MHTIGFTPGRSGRIHRVVVAGVAVLVAATVTVPPATADDGVAATGTFHEHSFRVLDQRAVGTDTVLDRSLKVNFKGTFDGTAEAVEQVTIHADGSGDVTGTISFTGCVSDRCGTAELAFQGTSPDSRFFDGRFTVVSGTGGLASLRGKGEFFHAPDGTYFGAVRF
jgi:hypothetical protein